MLPLCLCCHRQTFAAAGVSPDKLFVVPQGIDAAYFDPAKHEPLVLRELPGTRLVTGSAGDSYISSSSQGKRPYGEWSQKNA
jgi:hypothetical protein